jgi:hypothetical protein
VGVGHGERGTQEGGGWVHIKRGYSEGYHDDQEKRGIQWDRSQIRVWGRGSRPQGKKKVEK